MITEKELAEARLLRKDHAPLPRLHTDGDVCDVCKLVYPMGPMSSWPRYGGGEQTCWVRDNACYAAYLERYKEKP